MTKSPISILMTYINHLYRQLFFTTKMIVKNINSEMSSDVHKILLFEYVVPLLPQNFKFNFRQLIYVNIKNNVPIYEKSDKNRRT